MNDAPEAKKGAGMSQIVTTENFEEVVLKSDIPVLVDFYADWCGPCKMMSPVLDGLSEKLGGTVKIVKCNVDDNGAVAEKYGVMSIPNFIVFKGGEAAANKVGASSPADFENWIRENI